ncbi:hypothetical protein H4R34_001650 [Dimargaris verticillata]|uniref:PNPLA domain-containing protein n=1 Tax=Dimargaris verticillata TaxID=2761393 RepID=A0A9W8EA37_9FUNG|nr:hypothetical protein H4R34_001650 [Dimargaris verticillata]
MTTLAGGDRSSWTARSNLSDLVYPPDGEDGYAAIDRIVYHHRCSACPPSKFTAYDDRKHLTAEGSTAHAVANNPTSPSGLLWDIRTYIRHGAHGLATVMRLVVPRPPTRALRQWWFGSSTGSDETTDTPQQDQPQPLSTDPFKAFQRAMDGVLGWETVPLGSVSGDVDLPDPATLAPQPEQWHQRLTEKPLCQSNGSTATSRYPASLGLNSNLAPLGSSPETHLMPPNADSLMAHHSLSPQRPISSTTRRRVSRRSSLGNHPVDFSLPTIDPARPPPASAAHGSSRMHKRDRLRPRRLMGTGRHESLVHALIRFPLLAGVLMLIMVELYCYLLVRLIVSIWENLCVWRGRTHVLRQRINCAQTYDEWRTAAQALDGYLGNNAWKSEPSTRIYNASLLYRVTRQMRDLRQRLSQHDPTPWDANRGPTFTNSPDPSSHPTPQPSPPSPLPAGLDTNDQQTLATAFSGNAGGTHTTTLHQPQAALLRAWTLQLRNLLLHSGTKSNLGGHQNAALYTRTYYGTKHIIHHYVDETLRSLDKLYQSPHLSAHEKLAFFRKATRSYGQTALCLSGGATFGYHHLGVIKTFLAHGLLPKVVSGTSAGSLIAALTCCYTDDELQVLIRPELHMHMNACSDPWLVRLARFWREGVLFDAGRWAHQAQWITRGSTTFREAYERTGRILNITVVSADAPHASDGTKLLNYVTTPDVVVWSAILASSAIPGVLKPVVLMMKVYQNTSAENLAAQSARNSNASETKATRGHDGHHHHRPWTLVPYMSSGTRWCDGSLKIDIPLEALHRCFNVQYTIVSQVNPHIALFFYNRLGSVGDPAPHRRGKGIRGGFVLSSLERFFKLDLQKWLKVLRDLDLLPLFLEQNWSFIWLQRFAGDITMIPTQYQWSEYMHLLSDLDEQATALKIRHGETMAWPKLLMLRNRMLIEQTLTEYHRALRKHRAMAAAKRPKTQVPTVEHYAPLDRASTYQSPVWSASSVSPPLPMPFSTAGHHPTASPAFFRAQPDSITAMSTGTESDMSSSANEWSDDERSLSLEPTW